MYSIEQDFESTFSDTLNNQASTEVAASFDRSKHVALSSNTQSNESLNAVKKQETLNGKADRSNDASEQQPAMRVAVRNVLGFW